MSLSRGLSKVKNFLNLIEVPAILLLVWGAVSHFGLFPEFLLPSPEKVWSSFVELLVCGELWKHIAASAGRVFGCLTCVTAAWMPIKKERMVCI